MSVYQNINGTLTRMDASDLAQLAAVDTEGILGGTPGATTNGQTLVDQLAADDVQAQTDIGQIKTDLSDEVTARSTLGAHNLFPASSIFSSQTVNGLTYTVNSNDTVKINGTITTGQTFAHLNCDKTFTLPAGSYKFADGFATGTSGRCGIVLRKNNSSGDLLVSTATTDHSGAFTITEDTVVWARVYADNSDGAFSNVLVYPLLTVIEDTDSTFAPFAMTNRELTEGKFLGTVVSSVNLNDITESGVYLCNGSLTNSPSANYGFLMVLKHPNGTVRQIFFTVANSDFFYHRTKYQGTWSGWYKFTGTAV